VRKCCKVLIRIGKSIGSPELCGFCISVIIALKQVELQIGEREELTDLSLATR
jgi:hypothetical protein